MPKRAGVKARSTAAGGSESELAAQVEGLIVLAGLQAGLWPSLDALSATWALDRAFKPAEAAPSRDRRYAGWRDAVRRVRSS